MICNMEGGGGAMEATKDEVMYKKCGGGLVRTKPENRNFNESSSWVRETTFRVTLNRKRKKENKPKTTTTKHTTAHLGSGCSVVLR